MGSQSTCTCNECALRSVLWKRHERWITLFRPQDRTCDHETSPDGTIANRNWHYLHAVVTISMNLCRPRWTVCVGLTGRWSRWHLKNLDLGNRCDLKLCEYTTEDLESEFLNEVYGLSEHKKKIKNHDSAASGSNESSHHWTDDVDVASESPSE